MRREPLSEDDARARVESAARALLATLATVADGSECCGSNAAAIRLRDAVDALDDARRRR